MTANPILLRPLKPCWNLKEDQVSWQTEKRYKIMNLWSLETSKDLVHRQIKCGNHSGNRRFLREWCRGWPGQTYRWFLFNRPGDKCFAWRKGRWMTILGLPFLTHWYLFISITWFWSDLAILCAEPIFCGIIFRISVCTFFSVFVPSMGIVMGHAWSRLTVHL